jgi:hypothetical protein
VGVATGVAEAGGSMLGRDVALGVGEADGAGVGDPSAMGGGVGPDGPPVSSDPTIMRATPATPRMIGSHHPERRFT